MKRIIKTLSAMAAIATLVVSCNKEKDYAGKEEVSGDKLRFEATAAEVKTTIDNGSGTERIVKWAVGDEITIYFDDSSVEAAASKAGTSTTFEATTSASAENYYAVYPTDAASGLTTGDPDVLNVAVPAAQDGSFAKANIAVAKTTAADKSFAFKNATALVKFSVGDGYTKAVFTGNKGESLAGTVPVTFGSTDITLGEVVNPAKKIVVNLNGAGEYYFAVLPVDLTEGFSIALYDMSGDTTPAAYVLKEHNIERSHILNLGAIDGKGVSNIFVTETGGATKKNGKSWETALSTAELRTVLQQPAVIDGATIHIAAGNYYLAETESKVVTVAFPDYEKQVSVSFKGGYPSTLSGTTLEGRDTTQYRSVFTGENTKGIITVGANVAAAFEGITFQNCKIDAKRSHFALYAHDAVNDDVYTTKLTVKSCRFIGNQNTTSYTGAGLAVGRVASAVIEDCYFSGNYARNGSSLNLFNEPKTGTITISDCIFENNMTYNTSGAFQNEGMQDVTVERCAFNKNKGSSNLDGSAGANGTGGAAHFNGSAKTTFKNCSFVDNTSVKGGAISVQAGTVICEDCVFLNNKATFVDPTTDTENSPKDGSAGGAIIMNNASAKLTLNNCTFEENQATEGAGGAIAMQAASQLEIKENCSFSKNSAKTNGGVISHRDGIISIDEASFDLNHATVRGGVFYIATSNAEDVTVKNSIFTNNYCETSNDWGGGVLCARESSDKNYAIIENCVFNGNHSKKQGGVIALYSYTFLKMNNCLLENNYAGSRGMIRLQNNSVSYLNGVTFNGNYVKDGTSWGICIHAANTTICANNVTAFNNYAENPSAANVVSFNSDGKWLITNSTIIDPASRVLIRASSASNQSRIVLCNNILINSSDQSKLFELGFSTGFTNNGHNLLSSTTAATNTTIGSTDKTGITSLGDGAFFKTLESTGYLKYAGYSWNGILSDYSPAIQTDVVNTMKNDYQLTVTSRTSITNIGEDFYNWLGSLDPKGYLVDGRGIARTGTWWPGAYQQN